MEEQNEIVHADRFQEIVAKIKIKLFVLDVYANMNIEFHEDQTEMKRAQEYAMVAEYLVLGSNHYLLNIQDCRNINLSYTERKIMNEHLIKNINAKMKPLLKIDWSVVEKNQQITSDIIELEKKRRENFQKIAALITQVSGYIKEIAELQLSSVPVNKLDVLDSEANLLQVKSSLLRFMMIKQYKFRTDHAARAINEAKSFLDAVADET